MKQRISLLLALFLLAACLTACVATKPPAERPTMNDTTAGSTGTTQEPGDTTPATDTTQSPDTNETTEAPGDETLPPPEDTTEAETAPTIPSELSSTPAEEIMARLAPNAKAIACSTLGKEMVFKRQLTQKEVIEAFEAEGYYNLPIDNIDGARISTSFLLGKVSTVAVHYYAAEREVRVVWEDASRFDPSVLQKNEATDTGTLTFAQVGTERVNEKDNPMIGMIHLVKLSDGRALIIDGGTWNDRNIENISATLDKLEIAKDADGRYRVAAWIFTHAHGDHVGGAVGFMKARGNTVAVENFMYQFTKDASVIGSTSGNIDPFVSTIESVYPNANHIIPHANMKYYFGNATIAMLYAPELIYKPDGALSYYNNSSLVFRLSVGNSSILELGDAGNAACQVLTQCYNTSAFQSTVLQITHHGLYTEPSGHSWGNVKAVYQASGSKLALLPMHSKYDGEQRNGRHTVMSDWARAEFQISFVMNTKDVPASVTGSVTQAIWDEFEQYGTVHGEKVDTVYGYNGQNIVTNASGMVTYLGATRTTPMIVLLEMDGTGVTVAANQDFYTWAK